MKVKSGVALVAAGVGSAVLYQNIKNGNIQRMMRKMKKIDINSIKDLEDMI